MRNAEIPCFSVLVSGVDDEDVGVGPVGDPELGSVEDVVVSVLLCSRGHGNDVKVTLTILSLILSTFLISLFFDFGRVVS